MKNSFIKKILAITLSVVMLACVGGTVFADETKVDSQTIYVLLDSSGTARQTIVSNDGKQEKDVKGELPFNIKLEYSLNGTVKDVKEIVGKNGDIKITVNITPNEKTKAYYKENLALQMQFPLSTENGAATDIVADGLTAVTVGQTKTLSGIVLPAKSAKYTIAYKTKSFEQQSINFVCMPFDMSGTVDIDIPAVSGQVKQLQGGINAYIDGVSKAGDGLSQANAGIKEIAKNGDQLTAGFAQMTGGELQLMQAMLASMPPQQQAAFAQQLEVIKAAQAKLGESLKAYVGGVSVASAGLEQVTAGATALVKNGKTLKDGINSAITPLYEMANLKPSNLKAESFTSTANVSQIQFVMKTDSVTQKIIKEDVQPAAKPKVTFWNRLLALFGL